MASDSGAGVAAGDPQAPLAPGPLLRIGDGELEVDLAPHAGGRIAQIRYRGVDQLVGPDDGFPAAIAWGSYPMLPWAGRIRRGRFAFEGREWQLPANLEGHAIHGVSMWLPWQVEARNARSIELALRLPQDRRWPFGGSALQWIEAGPQHLAMTLSVRAGERAMPVVLGWHPWFRKPERIEFHPSAIYPRDADGIACLPTVAPTPGPWDDCFVNTRDVVVHRAGQRLRLSSDCDHWVVYDETAHSTCIEPQTGPADAFNLAPRVLEPGESLQAWFRMEWD
ncbi:aldose 1-epimerase [Pseudoxanthomonas suwonensis]|uniref:Aldose epimerase n=1 Tax=Pseudoxanthomonas suwonensis TaxID=314722 RepID=A0A0E3UMI3_9GAMM|nr:aldose epimerase [Pseudoxanthomonas suwonensis]AKC86366.1 aldose epimerase [Pseudoxanthomonas suwonensis]